MAAQSSVLEPPEFEVSGNSNDTSHQAYRLCRALGWFAGISFMRCLVDLQMILRRNFSLVAY